MVAVSGEGGGRSGPSDIRRGKNPEVKARYSVLSNGPFSIKKQFEKAEGICSSFLPKTGKKQKVSGGVCSGLLGKGFAL